MRGRAAVHRVYAEDEQAAVPYGERAAVSPDEPAMSYDTQPTESHEYKHAQPPWRMRPQGRILAMALLCAVIAFVMAFSIHALTTPAHVAGQAAGGRVQPPAPPARMPRRVVVAYRHHRRAHRAAHKPTATHSTPPAARITPPVVLRDEEHTAAHISTGGAPPAPPERGAIYELTFER